jgi:hypothetical protein
VLVSFVQVFFYFRETTFVHKSLIIDMYFSFVLL